MYKFIKKKNYGFTLVELIVVIVILSILGTIGFLSMQGYSANARDAARNTDLSNIQKALELYSLKTGVYPVPSKIVGITYSGSLAWSQGSFGEEPFTQVGNINKLPVDPLTGNEYSYSTIASKKEYQLAAVYESTVSKNKEILNKSYADGTLFGLTRIVGTYNGISLKVQSGSTIYILGVPSIIASDITSATELETIINTKKLSFNGKRNLPASYSGSKFRVDGQVDLGLGINNGNNLLIYSGNYTTLVNSGTLMLDSLRKIQNIYSGSLVSGEKTYSDIINIDITNNQETALNMASYIITKKTNSSLSFNSATSTPSCDVQPSYTHATFTAGTPTSVDESWQNSNSGNPCYYTCTDGYTGADCSIAPTQCAPGMTELTLSNGQTWSCMNLGATTVRDGNTGSLHDCLGSTTNCNSSLTRLGDYYQWGRNDTGWTNKTNSAPYYYGWEPADHNKWGGSGTTTTSGTYSTVSESNKTLMKGPCPTGWHVPTSYEWKLACINITGLSNCSWENYNPLFITTLKLPLAGARDPYDSGYYWSQNYNSGMWSSTPNTVLSSGKYYSKNLYFDDVWLSSTDELTRARGLPIRCMKNY